MAASKTISHAIALSYPSVQDCATTRDHLKMASNTELDHEVEETEEAGPYVTIVELVNAVN